MQIEVEVRKKTMHNYYNENEIWHRKLA